VYVALQERVHEFWMGPYLALSRARPDRCQVLLAPVMDCMKDVLQADDDDGEVFDRANLLMYYLVIHQMDHGRHARLKVCLSLSASTLRSFHFLLLHASYIYALLLYSQTSWVLQLTAINVCAFDCSLQS
jgi:hypothetical protein